MKRLFITIVTMLMAVCSANAQFAAKGHWMIGGNASFSTSSTDNLSLSLINGVNADGFSVKVAPEVCFFVADNVAIGTTISYGRNETGVQSGKASAGETDVEISDYYTIGQEGGLSMFMRGFIPLGKSNRFAMKVDVGVCGSLGEGKDIDAHTGYKNGAWHTKQRYCIFVNPGFHAFINDRMALSLGIGMANAGWTCNKQVTNQVSDGRTSSWNASYMLDLTALSFGLNFYL